MDMGAKAKSAISLSSHWQRARPAPSCTLLLPILTIYPRCAHTTPAVWAQWGSGSCQYCPSGLQVHCHGLSPRVHSFLRLQFWNLFLTICLPRWIWFFFFPFPETYFPWPNSCDSFSLTAPFCQFIFWEVPTWTEISGNSTCWPVIICHISEWKGWYLLASNVLRKETTILFIIQASIPLPNTGRWG